MSKSYDNYIGITENANDMYGKILSIPDNLLLKYYLLVANISTQEIEDYKLLLKMDKITYRDLKRKLARDIIKIYYNEKFASQAEINFDKIFIKKDIPEDIPKIKLNKDVLIVDVLISNELVKSKSEARRLIDQGAVKINDEKCIDRDHIVRKDDSLIIKVGKRRFLKII